MPSSDASHLWYLWDKIIELQPKTILDIWIWFGSKWAMFRELTDIRNLRYEKYEWLTQIDWIEIYPKYKNILYELYNQIYYWDCMEIIDTLWQYDLIYFWDVLEHLEKEKWLEFINKLKQHWKYIIISTPNWFYRQWTVYWNENETHLSGWTKEDFEKLWFIVNKFWILLVAYFKN